MDINTLGSRAADLLTQLLRDQSMVSRKRAEIKARTEKVRPMLRDIRAAFDRGETVNGFPTWTKWAEATGYTIRRLQQIIADPKPKAEPKPGSLRMLQRSANVIWGRRARFSPASFV